MLGLWLAWIAALLCSALYVTMFVTGLYYSSLFKTKENPSAVLVRLVVLAVACAGWATIAVW